MRTRSGKDISDARVPLSSSKAQYSVKGVITPVKKVTIEKKKKNAVVKVASPAKLLKKKGGKRTEPKLSVTLTRTVENQHSNKYEFVIGVDEAGRGPLAGPVVAASCFVGKNVHIEGIKDSKQTTEEEREGVYEEMMKCSYGIDQQHMALDNSIVWAVSVIDHKEIDRINILQASLKAMRLSSTEVVGKMRGILSGNSKTSKTSKKTKEPSEVRSTSNFVALVDGNRCPEDMCIDSKWVIKGDSSVYSIAAASIIAKVTRDRIMLQMDKLYPQYNFAQHKGYPTYEHRVAVSKYGPCPIHRLTYGPVKSAIRDQK